MAGLIDKLTRPRPTRHRLSPKEEKERQQALRMKRIDRYLSTLERENPLEYARLMAAEIEAEQRRRGIGGDDGEPVDPFQSFKAMFREVVELRDFLPPAEPRSEGAEILHGIGSAIGKALENPAIGARLAALLPPPPQGETVIDHRPPQTPPQAPPVHQDAPTPPQPSVVDPSSPFARFLPLLNLEPAEAAERIVEEADADWERDDEDLWKTLENAIRNPGMVHITLLGYAQIPAYAEGARALLARMDWTNAVVSAVAAIVRRRDADVETVVDLPKPVTKAKK